MNHSAELLVTRFAYIFGALSFIGFLIVARNEVKLWLQQHLEKRHVVGAVSAGKHAGAGIPLTGSALPPVDRTAILPGLIFLGGIVSTSIFIFHSKIELLELKIGFETFLLAAAAFTLLPGGLIGMAAGAWINATYHSPHVDLFQELVVGMLVYLPVIGLFELTEAHLLLFLCGPAITLLVYWFSPAA